MLDLTTPDPPASVADFYRRRLAGWKVEIDLESGGGRLLVLSRPGTGRSVTLVATPREGRTNVSLTASESP
jgi:hypothetical protein